MDHGISDPPVRGSDVSSWRRFLQGHRSGAVVVALALVVTMGGAIGFWWLDETPPFECSSLRDDEVRQSEEALVPIVEHQLDIDVVETDRLLAELDALGTEPADESEREEAVSRVRVAALKEETTRDRLRSLYRSALPPSDALADEEVQAGNGLDGLLEEANIGQIDRALGDRALADSLQAVVKLDADGPFPTIALGSSRADKRQEITLTGSARSPDEQGSEETGNQVSAHGPLLNKPKYQTSFGQFVSEDGNEIPRSKIHVWARRLGSNVLLSVCIDPMMNLRAGEYKGKVYLEDPQVDGDSVFVSVTAQHRRIDLLYLLLVLLPPLAMVYVWYTTEQPESGTAFNLKNFLDWVQRSSLILLGVGLASVWTALQVAFSNPTLGSSLFGAVAVVGGAAVAAITAMTAIAVTAGAARRRAENDSSSTER